MTGMTFGSFTKRYKDFARIAKPEQACKDQQEKIVIESQSLLRIWKDHFCRLLKGDEDTSSAVGQDALFNLDDDQECRPPDLEEVKLAICKLRLSKNAGADGLYDDLFKAAEDQ